MANSVVPHKRNKFSLVVGKTCVCGFIRGERVVGRRTRMVGEGQLYMLIGDPEEEKPYWEKSFFSPPLFPKQGDVLINQVRNPRRRKKGDSHRRHFAFLFSKFGILFFFLFFSCPTVSPPPLSQVWTLVDGLEEERRGCFYLALEVEEAPSFAFEVRRRSLTCNDGRKGI